MKANVDRQLAAAHRLVEDLARHLDMDRRRPALGRRVNRSARWTDDWVTITSPGRA